MAKIVINIDDKTYKAFTELISINLGRSNYKGIIEKCLNAIKHGKVLPKGHGDLVDKSKIYKAIYAEEDNCTGMGMTFDEMDTYNEGIDAMYSLVRGAKPIIEADKEVEK